MKEYRFSVLFLILQQIAPLIRPNDIKNAKSKSLNQKIAYQIQCALLVFYYYFFK